MNEQKSEISPVKAERLKKRYVQETVAKAAGITIQHLYNIEKGIAIPSVIIARKIAKFFDKQVEELFLLEEEELING